MSAPLPLTTRSRGRWRRVLDTFAAYVRLDLTEEVMFPTSSVLRDVVLIAPVFTYFFQSRFLGAQAMYGSTVVGVGVSAGLQFALTGFTSRLQGAQERGTLETYLVEPVPWRLIPVAMNAWPSVTGIATTGIMVGLGSLLGANLSISRLPAFFLVLLLGIVACNAIGTLSASFLVLFKRAEPIMAAYGLAASLLGGALFSINVLPGWIRWMSYLVPHAYVISAERSLLVPGAPNGGISMTAALVALLLFCIGGFAVGLRLFDGALERARRMGLLST